MPSIVTVEINRVEVGTTVVDDDGIFTLTVRTPLGCGTHEITATQTVDGQQSRRARQRAAAFTSAPSDPVTLTVECSDATGSGGPDQDTGGADGSGEEADDGGLLPDTGAELTAMATLLVLLLALGMVTGGAFLLRRRE